MGFVGFESKPLRQPSSTMPCHAVRLSWRYSPKGTKYPQFALTIGEDVMRACRWVVGDKVYMTVDYDERVLCVYRVPESDPTGWRLSPQGMHKKSETVGSTMRASTKMRPNDKFIEFAFPGGVTSYTVSVPAVLPNGILAIVVPKEVEAQP